LWENGVEFFLEYVGISNIDLMIKIEHVITIKTALKIM
jgi:hypothetical protein